MPQMGRRFISDTRTVAVFQQVMATALFLMDREEGVNVYKMDAKKRFDSISKMDRILKVCHRHTHHWAVLRLALDYATMLRSMCVCDIGRDH